MTELTQVSEFIADYQNNTVLWAKLRDMTAYVVQQTVTDMKVVKYKYSDGSQIGNEAIKEIMIENGYEYIKAVMDTITGFDFKTMMAFVNLIGNLKGTRTGMELVLKLMGFDSSITEWWEATPQAEPWSYKITVIVDSSLVQDLYVTLATLKVFSQNYVFAKISNIDLQFAGGEFAQAGAVMGGFISTTWRRTIIQKARP